MLPKMGVGALIFDEQKRILLQFRMNTDFYPNCWFIPCGRTEENENPRNAIIREVKEETSLEAEVVREVYKKLNEKGIPEIAYLCKIVQGVAKKLEPKIFRELKYFELNNLPEDISKRALEIINEYKKSPLVF